MSCDKGVVEELEIENTEPEERCSKIRMAGPFDEVLDAEEKMRLSGYDTGVPHGRARGRADGFTTGFSQGIKLAEEVGFYLGFVEYTLEECASNPLTGPEVKAKRALLQVAQYISEFHCLQLSSPTYLDQLSKIRAKFKQAASLLKLNQPQPASTKDARKLTF